MECLPVLMDAFKKLFTTFLSMFDIFSDAINSFDFLGYDASDYVIRKALDLTKRTFGSNSTLFMDLSVDAVANVTSSECKLLSDVTRAKQEISNTHIDNNLNLDTDGPFNNFSINGSHVVCDMEPPVHIIWGTLSISIMFFPGVVALIILIANDRNELISSKHWTIKLFIAGSILMFPISIVFVGLTSAITCRGRVFRGYIAIGIALEAFLESCLQLTLQIYTIFYGYNITNTQLVTIAGSFIILSKASIDLDTEMFPIKLNSCDKMKHYLKILPGHTSTIAFRVLSLAITIAFLREWCVIPMFLLMCEMFLVAYVCLHDCNDSKSNTIHRNFGVKMFALMITNLGVTNTGILGAIEFLYTEEIEEKEYVSEYSNETNRFIKLLSITTFLHHLIMLLVIMLLVDIQPELLEHWLWKPFILNHYNAEVFFGLVLATLSLGIIGLISTLLIGARSLTLAAEENVESRNIDEK